MKRIKRLICILLSIGMILSGTAVCAFGQTVDQANRGNAQGGSFKGLKTLAADPKNQFPGEDDTLSLTKIRINRNTAKIGRNGKLRLKAFYYPSTQKEQGFRWISTNRKVARVSPDGTVKGISPGRTNVMVFLRSNPGIRAVCKLTVGYSIKYQVKGGRLDRSSPRVYYNEKVVLKDPVKKGYVFKGWYTDKDRTKKITQIDRDADRDYTLYAKWEKA